MPRVESISGHQCSRPSERENFTSPNGVEFRDKEHKTKFQKLEKRGIFLGRTFYWSILEHLGLKYEIHSWIENLRWRTLVGIRLDGYEHLICEFFNSLDILEHGSIDYPQ